MAVKEPEFLDFFKEVPDHRIERRKLYSIEEILLLSFCAVISGCSSWDDIELYGQTKLDELRLYLPYKHGSPSDDTLRRFFRALDSSAFEAAFIKWVQSFQLNLETTVVAVDGKTSALFPFLLVTIRACDNRLNRWLISGKVNRF